MRILYILLSYLFLSHNNLASDDIFTAKSIPAELLKDATAVVRLDNGYFEIEKLDRATFKKHTVITILDESADHFAEVLVGYDKLIKVKTISASVYDKNGKLIKKLKSSDFEDYSNISGASLYEDNRVKYADLTQKDHPYTIEFNFELQYKYLYSVPNWHLVPDFNTAVQASNYIVTYPLELKPRYKLTHTTQEPTISTDKDLEIMKWEFSNYEAIDEEPLSRGVGSFTPVLQLAPSKFSYEGYSGDMSTWNGMAKWQQALNEGLNDLSEETKEQMRKLVADLPDKKSKVEAIYEYMQKRTRYISIQLGVGGFQPFSAATVDEVGYGDCKGLSFYTKCLLEAVGIEANYSWVFGGRNSLEVDPDFPYDNFNHIILHVPLENDTLWLECTNQKIPAGYLGGFTDDRYALVMNEDEAKLIKTPDYINDRNKIVLKAAINLDAEGNALSTLNSSFIGQGTEYMGVRSYPSLPLTDQEKWVRRYIGISDFSIKNFSFDEAKLELPELYFTANFSIRGAASKLADKYSLIPTLLDPLKLSLKKNDSRKSPVYLPINSFYEYEVEFILPDGYSYENLPENNSIVSDFGQYTISYSPSENGFTCSRLFLPKKGVFPAEDFNNFKSFFDEIRNQENKRVIISKK